MKYNLMSFTCISVVWFSSCNSTVSFTRMLSIIIIINFVEVCEMYECEIAIEVDICKYKTLFILIDKLDFIFYSSRGINIICFTHMHPQLFCLHTA